MVSIDEGGKPVVIVGHGFTGKIGGKDLIYGLTLNNNPTIQDAWNTLPGWGFPYTDSDYAPGPGASTLIAACSGSGNGSSSTVTCRPSSSMRS